MAQFFKTMESTVSNAEEVRDAQLTIVEMCDYGEGEISFEEMADLVRMITPTNTVPVRDVPGLDRLHN